LKIDHPSVLWFVGRGGGDAAEVSVFEAVGVSFEGDDLGVVDEPVDHGGGDYFVAEDFAPAIRGWHMLILNCSGCCLGNLCSGVSPDF
jgi:hypothetical protein